MIITDEKLIELGFKKYNTYNNLYDAKKYLFQKRYMNDEGDTLYFLDIYKWDWSFANDKVPEQYTYQITTQLYQKGTHEAINIEFGVGMAVEDAEKFIAGMFEAGMVEPYELAQ